MLVLLWLPICVLRVGLIQALGAMKIIDADPSLATRPDFGSGVSDRARLLRTRELADLSLGDVAFCLRQGIAIPHVSPLAISALAEQPFVEAELYPGDLLAAILHAAARYGVSNTEAFELSEICTIALSGAETIQNDVVPAALAFVAAQAGT
jgi:hypothetical protein